MLLASFLVVQGLQWQIIKACLAAVRYLHLTMGFPFPGQDESLPHLQLLLQCIRRVLSDGTPCGTAMQ